MKKAFLILITLLFAFSLSTTKIFAQEKINPDSGLSYKTKRLKEKIALMIKFSSKAKVNYYENLLDRRIYELKFIVENKQLAYLENTSQRYESTAGELTELVVNKKITSKKDELINKFSNHQKEIEKIRDNYSPETSEWRLIMNDFNSLSLYIEKLHQL